MAGAVGVGYDGCMHADEPLPPATPAPPDVPLAARPSACALAPRCASSRSRRLRRAIRSALGTAAILLVPIGARASLVDHYKVPTGSMRPTVEIGDRVFVYKAAYGLRLPLASSYLFEGSDPARGDVVVLRSPEDPDVVLLKRVVAVPGDVVAVRAGRIYLDGDPAPISGEGDTLLETLGGREHRVRLQRGGGPDFGPVTLPARRFLVVGDNRGDSLDGRSFGLVERDAFLGHAKGVVIRDGVPTWQPL